MKTIEVPHDLILSHLVLSHLVLSHLVLSHLILSHLILSRLLLSRRFPASRTPQFLWFINSRALRRMVRPTLASRTMVREEPRSLIPRSLKRRDEFARLPFRREQDHLFARLAELIHVLVDDAAELGLQRRGFLALAVR
jgi:hypothetical protein